MAKFGVEPSRVAVETRVADPDFGVRLEAAQVLAGDVGSCSSP
jgi:hypothetical protein